MNSKAVHCCDKQMNKSLIKSHIRWHFFITVQHSPDSLFAYIFVQFCVFVFGEVVQSKIICDWNKIFTAKHFGFAD